MLFINANLCVAVDGLPNAESEALLQEIFAYLYAPHRIHYYHWRAGDLLVFDNVALQHSRCLGPHRTLRRVVVSAEPLATLISGARHHVTGQRDPMAVADE